MRDFMIRVLPGLLLLGVLAAKESAEKISPEQRAVIVRAMVAERGTAKLIIPRSKKALSIHQEGGRDEDAWEDALDEYGPAARVGDLLEITKVEFKGNRIVLELNHGLKGGRKWWHRVQVSGAQRGRGTTLGQTAAVYAPGGTKIALVFPKVIPPLDADEVKRILKPVLDFDQRSATELYMEKLPKEFQEAIEEERVVAGMDRDMVLLAKGKPQHKVRDFKDGVETEDWIYGIPPGSITFVTFEEEKVIRVKEAYAHVGGRVKTREDPEQQP